MEWLSTVVELVSGAAGGNIAGNLLEKYNLGPLGNSLAGILGGGLGGELLSMFMGNQASSGATIDLASLLGHLGSGGIGGTVLMIVIGIIKERWFNKSGN
ncbi:hypothetical protein C5615_32135 [Burkholderia cepacia]|uniref:DNA methyltransferase n=1 Tax=Burkholderia cepacia TaxID=292 RepID=A0A2S8I9H7_BURCE|nr:hypothetical protein [Burkholderia cepacia]PQP11417.1 hypothetical protein C5615_32135 [Burkholderia cepacia]HDR9511005.1 hypothetical protein [Burkholderia cepacia]